MKQHVVILGAGFAGLELAARLSQSVPDLVDVTLIDQNDAFVFGFSKLDVLFGRRDADDVRHPYRDIAKSAVEFRQERVTAIDPATRRVTTDSGAYDADILVVALGADYDFAATPGFAEGGLEYYSVAGAERMRDTLADFEGGTILIGILGQPFKCPPAPFEGAFMLHDYFVERGVRAEVEIRVVAPMAAPVPVTPEVSQVFQDELRAREIEYLGRSRVVRLDPEGRTAQLEGGEELSYDLFVGIPVHRVPDVVDGSGLAEDGWVPVDRDTLATRFPNVYAVGDLVKLPMAKAGVFAENAAGVVGDNIAAALRGQPPARRYEGEGNCFIEFGGGRVGKIQANFLGGEAPTAQVLGPSTELAAEKKNFARVRRARWFGFPTPAGLAHNRGLIADPEAFARDAGAASWLYLCGEEFAAMEGGMSYASVRAAVEQSENIVSDPPTVMDMDLAGRHVAALDRLPRPTLVTCRTGPRSSAVIYLYAGLRAGADPDDVIARAEADGAPFAASDELKAWVRQGLAELS